MLVIGHPNNFSIAIWGDMTVDAFGQAMFFAANTLVHGFIALMQQVIHVISSHICRWLNTFFAFRCRHYIAIRIPIGSSVGTFCKAVHAPQQQGCGDEKTGQLMNIHK